MMRNKNFGYIILGVLFVMISVIMFAVPTAKTGTFWTAYVFTVIAFIAQIAVWKVALGKEGTPKSKFLGLPVVYIGIVYLIVQIIAFAIFTAVPSLPTWIAVIVCAIILGVSAVCMIAGGAAREKIENVEEKAQKKVSFIKELQVDVELLAEAEVDSGIKNALQQLAEKIRYSDPMSNKALEKIEDEIAKKIAELKVTSDKMAVIQKISLLLIERNKKCKMMKNKA